MAWMAGNGLLKRYALSMEDKMAAGAFGPVLALEQGG